MNSYLALRPVSELTLRRGLVRLLGVTLLILLVSGAALAQTPADHGRPLKVMPRNLDQGTDFVVAIGAVFGSVFLLFNPGTTRQQRSGMWDTLTLLTGPVTLLATSLVGLKFEEIAGVWLLIGAAVTAGLLVAVNPWLGRKCQGWS
jgi:hypothetical protein